MGSLTIDIVLVDKHKVEKPPEGVKNLALLKKKALTFIYGTGFNPVHELEPLRLWVGENDPEALARLCYLVKSLQYVDKTLTQTLLDKFIARIKDRKSLVPQFTAVDADKYAFGYEILSYVKESSIQQ